MTDIDKYLATKTCPADLNDVRDFTVEEKCGPNFFKEKPCLEKLEKTNAKLRKYNRQMARCWSKKYGPLERPSGQFNEVYAVENEFVIREKYRPSDRNFGGIKYLDMSGTVFVEVCPEDSAEVEEVKSEPYCARVAPAAEKEKCLRETKGLLGTIRKYNNFMLTDCGGTITDGKRRLLPWGSGQEPAGSSVSKVREIERRREDSDDQFNREIDQNFVREQRENARLSKARAEAEAAEMARALEGIARAIAAGRGGGGSFGDGGGRLDSNQCAQILASIRQIEQALATGHGSPASRQQTRNALNQNISIYNSRCH